MRYRRQIYKVIYTVKTNRGFIVDMSRRFSTFTEAYAFIQELKYSGKLVGKPELGG
jgi:hypothetical protein